MIVVDETNAAKYLVIEYQNYWILSKRKGANAPFR